jgi:hypothetical protein
VTPSEQAREAAIWLAKNTRLSMTELTNHPTESWKAIGLWSFHNALQICTSFGFNNREHIQISPVFITDAEVIEIAKDLGYQVAA